MIVKVIIAGSRTIKDYKQVEQAVADSGWAPQITEVVCGESEEACYSGKINVDILGWEWAVYNRIPVKHFEVTDEEWDRLGKPAGPMRNGRMAAYGEALILVWDGTSRGSKSMKEKAEAAGLPVFERIVKGGGV